MKRKINLFLLVVLLINLCSGVAFANSKIEDSSITIPNPDYTRYKLDNGLEIYVLEDHQLPLVDFSVWYKVGSIDERDGISGISHLLEHTMFLGTETLDKGQIHKLVKTVGGSNNAGTYYDYTKYYEQVPSSKLELAMAIEADRMRNLAIKPQEFKREKEVVKQERRKRIENNVFGSSLERVQKKAWLESPLEHQIIGWMEDLNQISEAEMKDYYNQYYAPNNAVLVVSGAVEAKRVKELATKYYGDYQSQKIERVEYQEPQQQEERKMTIRKVTKVPFIQMIYKIPAANHQDSVAIRALLDILINNSSSRIKQKLKQEQRLILGAGSNVQSLREEGMAMLYLIPMKEDLVTKVQANFEQQLQQIKQEGVSKEELEIVRKNSLKSLVFNQRYTSNVANRVAKGVVRFDNPNLYKEEFEKLKNLTEADIIRVANKYFNSNNRTVGHVLPKKK